MKVSDPVVSFRETCTAKCANKHNCLFIYAEVLRAEPCVAIENGDITAGAMANANKHNNQPPMGATGGST